MLLHERSWLRYAVTVLAAIGLAPTPAAAQLAPVAGAHYDSMSGNGGQGGANALGGYGTSVPLGLPGARGGLPIPVQLNYGGGKTVGAVGLGWDVPLSYILLSTTAAHRRPSPLTPTAGNPLALAAPERWTLNLLGSQVDLVRNAANNAWVGRRGSTQIEVRSSGDGVMVVYDGAGRTYNFSSRGATAGSRLMNGNMYLLTSIVGADGNQARLSYAIGAPTLPGGGTGLAVSLSNVVYNKHPTTADCFKHKVYLNYDAASSTPLAMAVVDGAVWTRVQKLSSVSIKSKETCASSEKTLSTYNLTYQPDTDTGQPRLQSVTMTGQQGTPEQYVALPVATYSYGAVVDRTNGGAITFEAAPDIAGQSGFYDFGFSRTSLRRNSPADPAENSGFGLHIQTGQMFRDFNGDARPDYLSTVHGLFNNKSGATPISFGEPQLTPLFNPVKISTVSPIQVSAGDYARLEAINSNYVMRSWIDMNGDGRVDEVSPAGRPLIGNYYRYSWKIRLNTPDPNDPGKSTFVDRYVFILPPGGGANLPFSEGAHFLEKKTTVPESPYAACWQGDAVGQSTRLPDRDCPDFPADNYRRKTITEIELIDINGDGYPDAVYNETPVRQVGNVVPLPDAPPHRYVNTTPSDMTGSRDVKVLFNVAGINFSNSISEDTTELFSRTPVTLEVGGAAGCGVARWEMDPASLSGGKMNQVCGFIDVNGDGLVDRVTTNSSGVTSAKLGTGDMANPFYSGATIVLPGPIASSETFLTRREGESKPTPDECRGDDSTYRTIITRQIKDINGDGIPDYWDSDLNHWRVHLGTGVGFAEPVLIVRPYMYDDVDVSRGFSVEKNKCGSGSIGPGAEVNVSGTTRGIYDLDGNGQPEVVFQAAPNSLTLKVFQLKAPVAQVDVGGGVVGVPAAGRLTRIDYGYGASTTIGYRSAKEEWNPSHYVPFPEIVVESVGTKDANNASLMSTTRYAYRGAEMIFDPVYDTFRFPGYRRSVALTHANGKGTATITDTYGLEPYVSGMSETERFGRYLKAGLTSDVTTVALSGVNHDNPWDVLNINIANDTRRLSGAHYDWDVRLLPGGPALGNNARCLDILYPYDFAASQTVNAQWPTQDVCTQHGFVFQGNVFAWRGLPQSDDALASTNTVQTNTAIRAIDDFERVTDVRYDNDLNIEGDDQCTQTQYASPTGTNARVLNAPALIATRSTPVGSASCNGGLLLSNTTFEYDTTAAGVKLPAGKVSNGWVTAQDVWRLDSATGLPIDPAKPSVRSFDAIYDTATGNPLSVTSVRDDGASIKATTSYDPFGLAVVGVETKATRPDGSALPLLNASSVVDATTLKVLSATDSNGTKSGATYDGFGRVVLSTLTPSGGSEGVMAKSTYNGFGVGQTGGRSIVQKVFTDPVPVASVNSAPGRSGTVFLDSLGRTQRSEVALGADYANQTLVVGERIYDAYGRVEFEADPYTAGQNLPAPYGTTQHYRDDGTPQCTYRAYGKQAFELFPTTSEASERLVSCVSTRFIANRQEVLTSGADSKLAGAPQEYIARQKIYSAIGQLLRDRTMDLATDYPFEESMEYGYDPLGRMTSVTRMAAPGGGDEMSTVWRYDSLGQVIEFHDGPAVAPQYRRYDSWGALTATEWCDTTTASCSAGTYNRGLYNEYDALGRVLHSEERSNNAVLPETVRDFVYDQGVNNTTPPVTASYVLGRLAKATAPTSSVSYSYDALGRTQAEVHTDRTTSSNNTFVQKYDYHGDGSMKTLHLLLPDAAFRDEKADYAYDSAGRMRSVKYSDGVLNKDLFTTNGANDIDVFGRIRQAQYGVNTYTASYDDVGRRLLNSIKVTSPGPMTTSREFVFAGTNGALPAFDPIGRERSRKEIKNGDTNAPTMTSTYDALGRLTRAMRIAPAGASLEHRDYEYDSLGNILSHSGADAAGTSVALATLSYGGSDIDRLCGITFNGVAPSPGCNVKYDGVGNIVEMPTRSNGTRTLSYFPSGSTRTIAQGGTLATYDYDAFGGVQRLRLTSPSAADTRNDKHFGGLIGQRDELVAGIKKQVTTRAFPGPGGLIATRHGGGTNDPWTFAFGEQRGSRFFTDHTGAFVQDVDYQPYGEVRAETATLPGSLPGSQLYSSAQWNGGDALAALGVSQLGARIYDPVIGRFLSRDPLFIPRTAATTNAYAFAMNDPVNRADPSGLDCVGLECNGPPIFGPTNPPGGGGGGGGGGGRGFDPCDSYGNCTLPKPTPSSKPATPGPSHTPEVYYPTGEAASLAKLTERSLAAARLGDYYSGDGPGASEFIRDMLQGFCDMIACNQETGGGDTGTFDAQGVWTTDSYVPKRISYGDQAKAIAIGGAGKVIGGRVANAIRAKLGRTIAGVRVGQMGQLYNFTDDITDARLTGMDTLGDGAVSVFVHGDPITGFARVTFANGSAADLGPREFAALLKKILPGDTKIIRLVMCHGGQCAQQVARSFNIPVANTTLPSATVGFFPDGTVSPIFYFDVGAGMLVPWDLFHP